MTQRDKWKHRPIVDKYFSFCDEVRLAFGKITKFSSANELHVLAYFKRDGKAIAGDGHTKSPDADNILKAVMDALVERDETIFSVSCEKYWARESYLIIRLVGARD